MYIHEQNDFGKGGERLDMSDIFNRHIGVSDGVTAHIEPDFNSDKHIKMRLRMCHAGMNRKGFKIDPRAISRARDTITNIPILAHVVEGPDGKPSFGSHDMHVEQSVVDGTPKLIYDEGVIGVIPETCNYAEEEHDGRIYSCVDAYIFKWYSNYAEDVLDARNEVPLSIEMSILSANYSAAEDLMTVTDFSYDGVTLLGDDVTPACINAKGIVISQTQEFMAMCEEVEQDVLLHSNEQTGKTKEVMDLAESNSSTVNDTENITDTEATATEELDTTEAVAETTETGEEETATEETTETPSMDTATQLKEALAQIAELSAEVKELRAAREAALAEKKLAEIQMAAEEFTDLVDQDAFKALMSEASEIPTVDAFKEKAYAIRGRCMNVQQLQAAVSDETRGKLRAPFQLNQRQDKKSSPLEKITERYGK